MQAYQIQKLLVLLLVATLALPSIPAAHGEEPSPTAPPVNRMEGRVLTADKETPVVDATVAVVDVQGGFLLYRSPTDVFVHAQGQKVLLFFTKQNEARSALVRTDAQGRFRIEGLKAGNYHILAVHPQFGIALDKNVMQPTTGAGVDLVLESPTFVKGMIRGLAGLNGREMASLTPLSQAPWFPDPIGWGGTRISVQPSFKLEADGSFHVGPLPFAGDWTLQVEQFVPSRRFGATLLKAPLRVKAATTNQIEIDLTQGAALEGRVIGPTGEPLTEVAVSVASAAGRVVSVSDRQYGAVTDADGKFAIRGLADGRYQLDAKRWGRKPVFG